jgi:hypothetical protein
MVELPLTRFNLRVLDRSTEILLTWADISVLKLIIGMAGQWFLVIVSILLFQEMLFDRRGRPTL